MSSTSIFTFIKENVPIREVIQDTGTVINRNGYCKCPFHNEKTASMKVFSNNFHCFGCGADGDVVDFVSMYYNIATFEAIRKLDKEYNLNLVKEDYTPEEWQEYAQRAKERERRLKERAERKAAAEKELAEVQNRRQVFDKAIKRSMDILTDMRDKDPKGCWEDKAFQFWNDTLELMLFSRDKCIEEADKLIGEISGKW